MIKHIFIGASDITRLSSLLERSNIRAGTQAFAMPSSGGNGEGNSVLAMVIPKQKSPGEDIASPGYGITAPYERIS
jgi:hypothetical protein